MFLYAVFFQAGVLAPRTVAGGGPVSGTSAAVLIDVLLLGLFAVQHSVMARAAFKHRLTQWLPIPTVLWRVDDTAARTRAVGIVRRRLDVHR